MNLRDYVWFANPRGLVSSGVMVSTTVLEPFVLTRFTQPQMGWAKLIVGGAEMAEVCAQLIANECMPIIRIGGGVLPADPPETAYSATRAYIEAGVRYFELYDLPNLPSAWPTVELSWENREVIAPLMDTWIAWAERIIELGGCPAFPALHPSTERDTATVYWLHTMLQYLKAFHADRMQAIIANGLWCATASQVGNRYYQEPPGGPGQAARPYYQQSADEPGWHFEYPYDPIQQKHDEGRTVFGGTRQAPMGDPFGLIASGQAFQELLKRHFDAGPVPVIATSGGIFPVPHQGALPVADDPHYPPYSDESHAEATLAMFEWIARQGPPWFWGVTLTSEAEYYETQGTIRTIDRLIETPPIFKDVPSIDTGGVGVVRTPEIVEEMDHFYEPSPTPEPEAVLEVDEEIGGADLVEEPIEEADDFFAILDPEIVEAPNETLEEAPTAEIDDFYAPPPTSEPEIAGAALDSEAAEREPDYHWLLLANDLDAAWFFDSASRYWQIFHPTVLNDLALIRFVPPESSLAVTVLAPEESLPALCEAISAQRPGVLLDRVPFDSLQSLQAEMNRRAIQQKRFG